MYNCCEHPTGASADAPLLQFGRLVTLIHIRSKWFALAHYYTLFSVDVRRLIGDDSLLEQVILNGIVGGGGSRRDTQLTIEGSGMVVDGA